MSESTLSTTRAILLREVGRFLGWDRDPANWTANQTTDSGDILLRGLRQFYLPPPLDGEKTSHVWSFLTPVRIITTITGQGNYDLADDFGGAIEKLVYRGTNAGVITLRKITVTQLLEMRQNEQNAQGYSQFYAISPLLATGAEPSRWQLMLHPLPSGSYDMSVQYRITPNALTSSNDYPLGGEPAADALNASVVAAADAVLNDNYHGDPWLHYMNRLRAAIYYDRQMHVAGNLGQSCPESRDYAERDIGFTINGSTPESNAFYLTS